MERFLNHTVFQTPADLRNRTLHIHWKSNDNNIEPSFAKPQFGVLNEAKPQNEVLKTPFSIGIETFSALENKLTIKELAVIKFIMENDRVSLKEMASKPGMSKGTIDRIIKSLKEKGVLQRIGPKNNSRWEIIFT